MLRLSTGTRQSIASRLCHARVAVLFIILSVVCCDFVRASENAIDILEDHSLPNVQQPQIAVGPRQQVAVVFGTGDEVFVMVSKNSAVQGQTLLFRQPIKIGEIPKLALGMRRGPRVVWTPEAIVVTALSHENGNVWSWSSIDEGRTWRGPQQINDVEASAREGLQGLAAGSNGLVYCVWLDLRSGKTELFGASSTDGGKIWSKNERVYQSPDGSICECCHPSVVIDDRQRIHVLFRNSIDGDRDMFLVQVTTDGQQDSAKRLGFESWKLKACPMDGGAIAISTEELVETIWRRERAIFVTRPNQAEMRLGEGEQPVIAASESGFFGLWLKRRGGALMLLAPDSSNPIQLAESANDPVVASAVGGKRPVVAAWEAEADRERTIMLQVLEPGENPAADRE